jgi:hypothetical protein
MAEVKLTSQADFNEPFNIVFSIGDIRDVSFGSNNQTYSINVPLTKINKNLLRFITQSDVKSEPSDPVSLYLDDQLIIKGKMVVLSYDEYSAKIIISCDDWMDVLSNKKITALDFSDSDHILNDANVIASWSASYPMYRYPMIDFGQVMSGELTSIVKWLANDFIPMISIAGLVRKILGSYIIVSDWLDTVFVKDLYILGREILADDAFIQNKGLEVYPSNLSDNQDSESGNYIVAAFLSKTLVFSNTVKDEAIKWLSTTYTIPESGTYRFQSSIKLRNTAHGNSNLGIDNETVSISILRNGTAIVTAATPGYTGAELIENITYSPDTGYVHFDADDLITVSVEVLCRVTVTSGTQTITVGVDPVSKLINVWDNACKYTGVGANISLEEMLPDMTQLDFLAAIRDIFNLRFWMDNTKRTIYIEPWDSFVSDNIVDISELVDYESLPTELISPNYSKTNTFKWADDSGDQAYKDYLAQNIVSPGLVNITLTSLFTKPDINVREHPFATVIESRGNIVIGMLLPRIWNSTPVSPYTNYDRLVNFTTRIVHWDGLTSGFSWNFDGTTLTQYPKISGVQWLDIYNAYWQKFFHWIDKGKLSTIKIKVKPAFLAQFLTVINDASTEAFRTKYQIEINGIRNNYILQKITSDGQIAELELIII